MFQKVREEVKACRALADDLDAALTSTMHSSKGFNDVIMDARARMKVCLEEMKRSELPPRKERAIR